MTQRIPIGTLVVGGNPRIGHYIEQILPHGFESIQLFFWQTLGERDPAAIARDVRAALAGSGVAVSALGIYGNPLEDAPTDRTTRADWARLIDHAAAFDCDLVTGFTGRVRGQSIEAALPRFRDVFGPLAAQAAANGVRLAFENCHMGGTWHSGDWNLAHGPRAWELLFNAVPTDNLGLEWEPCHQLLALVEPMPQLRAWASKIFHVHGKDANIHWDTLRTHGVDGPESYGDHRFPGFGDSDWTAIIDELRRVNYQGAINIEGWHDPIYRDALEMTGQVAALRHLKQCRGEIIANPT